jgi:hypothetical protein
VRSSLTCFWWEQAIWLLVNACLGKMRSGLLPERRVGRIGEGSAHPRPLQTDRQSNHASSGSYRTNHPPCYGRGCGVRLVVDSTLPVMGSTSSTAEAAPDSETQEGTIHLLGLQPYGRAWNR